MPSDEKKMKSTEIQKIRNRFQDVNKNEVKQKQTKIPVNLEYERNHQKLEILLTKKQTLSSGAARKVWPLGRNHPRHIKPKAKDAKSEKN